MRYFGLKYRLVRITGKDRAFGPLSSEFEADSDRNGNLIVLRGNCDEILMDVLERFEQKSEEIEKRKRDLRRFRKKGEEGE